MRHASCDVKEQMVRIIRHIPDIGELLGQIDNQCPVEERDPLVVSRHGELLGWGEKGLLLVVDKVNGRDLLTARDRDLEAQYTMLSRWYFKFATNRRDQAGNDVVRILDGGAAGLTSWASAAGQAAFTGGP